LTFVRGGAATPLHRLRAVAARFAECSPGRSPRDRGRLAGVALAAAG
jgi:hypothetical protein